MKFFNIAVLIIAFMLSSCDLNGGGTAGLNPSIAIAYGKIMSDTSTPISNARVFFNISHNKKCDRPAPDSLLSITGQDLTNENGEYRIKGKYMHIARQTFCVELKIEPPAESKFDTTVVVGDSVTFIIKH